MTSKKTKKKSLAQKIATPLNGTVFVLISVVLAIMAYSYFGEEGLIPFFMILTLCSFIAVNIYGL